MVDHDKGFQGDVVSTYLYVNLNESPTYRPQHAIAQVM